MTSRDFEKLSGKIFADSSAAFVKGPLTVIRPVKHVLRCFYFEGSSFDKRSFYVWWFFLPLFVPARQLSFNLGKRVRRPNGGDRWHADASDLVAELREAVEREALPFLSGIESVEDIAKAASTLGSSSDPYVQQAIAYAWAYMGNVERGIEELERLVHSLDSKIQWQREIAERAERLKAKLNNPAEVQQQFWAWENESSKNLGIEKLRQP